MSKVSVIIPTLNENHGIVDVLEKIPYDGFEEMGYDVEVLVVDGGSTDGTRERAGKMGADVYLHEGGKASAVRRGLKESDGDYVFLIDGDGSYPPSVMVRMVEKLENGATMVIGSRFLGEIQDGSMSKLNKFGNRVLTRMANKWYPEEVSDLCTGLRGFKRGALNGSVPGVGFQIEAGLHTVFAGKGVAEVPIKYAKRKGESKLRTVDGLKIARLLWKKRKGKGV
ncbi:MAG: glycosyltransferase family 2 protein [Thermoplasmata archaeon]